MPVLLLFVVLLLAFPTAPSLAAQIEPDRPELTESAKLVPWGSFQVETGVALSKERRAGEATARIQEVEADVDITLGFRYRFVEAFEDYPWPPHLAVKPFVKLPVADEPIGTGSGD